MHVLEKEYQLQGRVFAIEWKRNRDRNEKKNELTTVIHLSNMTSHSREHHILESLKMYDDADG